MVKWAAELGANLQEALDPPERPSLLENVCPHCHAFLPGTKIEQSLARFRKSNSESGKIGQESLGLACSECLKPPSPTPAARPAEKTDQVKRCVAARMVDFYLSSGERFRETYYVRQLQTNQGPSDLFLYNGTGKCLLGVSEDQVERIEEIVEGDIEKNRGSDALVVEHTGWVAWEKNPKFHPKAFERYPWRYDWNATERKWESPTPPPKIDSSMLAMPLTCFNQPAPSPVSTENGITDESPRSSPFPDRRPLLPRTRWYGPLIRDEEGCSVCGTKESVKWMFRTQTNSRVCWDCYG